MEVKRYTDKQYGHRKTKERIRSARSLTSALLFLFCCFLTVTGSAQKQVRFSINTQQARKAISPLIYGTNDPYDRAGSLRLGGNRLSSYNWETNASNAGRDWIHSSDNYVPWTQRVPENEYDSTGSSLRYFQNRALSQNAYSLLTLPMAKYVAVDKFGAVPETEAAPSARWAQVLHRKPADKLPLQLKPDLTDGTVYTEEEVNFMLHHFGKSNTATGVKAYSLDNEPGLWFDTHSRMFGHRNVSVKYLMDQSFQVAEMVKEKDPTAEIYGPASWGVSEFENLQFAPDWDQEKGPYSTFIDLYLARMKQRGEQLNKRLLDVLDLHWYPQTNNDGIAPFSDNTDYATNAVRMAMPRSLWDSTYIENTWIGADPYKVQQFLPFIPKINQHINTYYPGTKFAITEYSYMGAGHVSGGIAQADALGIFGKQGLYMATYWGAISGFVKSGFEIYRNYDGKGGSFGNVSVASETNDIVNSSVYASITDNDESKLHTIAMNKSQDESLVATITVQSGKQYKSARVWAFDNSTETLRQLKNIRVINNNTFEYTIPALTVCHFVLTEEDLSVYPDVEEAKAEPAAGYSDGTASLVITAKVTDGNQDLAKVTADLTALGGSAAAALTQSTTDATVYTVTYPVPVGTASGLKFIKIVATDATNLTAEATVTYRVIKKTSSSLIWDGDSISKGVGQAFYDGRDSKIPLIKVQRDSTGGNTAPGSLYMHFEHAPNLYNVMTWRISNADNPADAVDISDYGALEFYIRSNAPAGSDIEVSMRDATAQLATSAGIYLKQNGYIGSFSKDAYTKVRIPLSVFTAGSNVSLNEIWQFNFHCNTASKGFDVWVDDIRVVPYSHPLYQPVITEASVTPAAGYADGKTNYTVSAKVTDPDNNLQTVTVDLSAINGPNNQAMQLVNGVYTFSGTIPSTVLYGKKLLRISATDQSENATDKAVTFQVYEKASDLVLWDGDSVNTGSGITVNTATTIRVDSTGGKTAPVSMNIHLDMADNGFASAHWDWNEGTFDSELKDLSRKGYVKFYLKVKQPTPNFDLDVFLKDRFGRFSKGVSLKAGGYVSSFTGDYQLIRIPMEKLWGNSEVDRQQMARLGVLAVQLPQQGVDIVIDDIIAGGSNVAEVTIDTTNAKCGPNGSITVAGINGSLINYTFFINGQPNPAGITNPKFSSLAPATYEIRIEGPQNFVYVENITVGGSAQGITVSGTSTATAIDITVAGGSGQYSYRWSNNAVTEDLSGLAAGTYTVTVTDRQTGCTALFSATVAGASSKPGAETTVTDAACGPNGKILVHSITGSAGNHRFYSNGKANPAGIDSAAFTNLKPGTYTIRVEGDGGFSWSKKVTVAGIGKTLQLIGNVKNDNIDITARNGSGIYIYQWSEGSTTQDLKKVPDGHYTVLVTDAATQCTASATFKVLVPGIELSATDANCTPDGTITVTSVKGATGNYRFYINNQPNPAGITNPVFTGLKPSTYTIKVEADNNFKITKKISVGGSATGPIVTAVCDRENINLTVKGGSGIYTYAWSEGSTTQNLWKVTPGKYSVLVTDLVTQCTTTFSVDLSSYAETVTEDLLVIYPNPVKTGGQLKVKYAFTGKTMQKLVLKDHFGVVLFSKNLSAKSGEVYIPMQNIKPGMYAVMLQGTQQLSRQVIVE